MTRTCLKCETEQDDTQFQYGKDTRNTCKACMNKWRREAAKKYKEESSKIKKTCTSCNKEKDGTHFAYSLGICKECKSERDKEENNKPPPDAPPRACSKCNKEQEAKQFRYQSNVCITCEKERLYEWRNKNPEKFKEICKNYREKDDYREKQNTYKRDRYANDLHYKLQTVFRNRIRYFVKGGNTKGNEKYETLLACSWDTLREWLESNFTDGMTWENYGTLWHIDHTMPCSVFDLSIEENQRVCFNWSNLAPMLGPENLSKSNKINMALVTKLKEKARAFIVTHLETILTESLPADLQV